MIFTRASFRRQRIFRRDYYPKNPETHPGKRDGSLIIVVLRSLPSNIVNVTAGLAFVPLARTPIYCATKAALHSFTLSLRHQLAHTPIRVVEIVPPAVNTDLGGPGLHTFGVPAGEFADAVVSRLRAGDLEIPYGFSAEASRASREEREALFTRMNQAVG